MLFQVFMWGTTAKRVYLFIYVALFMQVVKKYCIFGIWTHFPWKVSPVPGASSVKRKRSEEACVGEVEFSHQVCDTFSLAL